jgi:hypothetical protein
VIVFVKMGSISCHFLTKRPSSVEIGFASLSRNCAHRSPVTTGESFRKLALLTFDDDRRYEPRQSVLDRDARAKYPIECEFVEALIRDSEFAISYVTQYELRRGVEDLVQRGQALRNYRRTRAGTVRDLVKAARVSRVQRILQPYLKAVT